jgi:stage II sporulation protein M
LIGTYRRARPRGPLGFLFGMQADYVRRLVPLFLLSLTLFSFSLFMGFHLGGNLPSGIMDELMGAFPDLEELDFVGIFLFIVFNNVVKSFLWMLLGLVGSVPPIFFSILNGFYIGWFSYEISMEHSLGFTIAALIPHGIVEVPTILLSSAAGMGLGYQLVNHLRGKGSLKAEFGLAISLFIRRIVPLLILAAILEVTLTPFIVVLFGFA